MTFKKRTVTVILALLVALPATAGWRGRPAAVLSMIGFGCLMVDYYVVNTVIVGLHSYAGT